MLFESFTLSVRVLKPNTPHAILSLEHTVTESGYFYATATLQETFWGLVHHFVLPHVACPSLPSHPELDILDCSRFLLRQLVTFIASEFCEAELDEEGGAPII